MWREWNPCRCQITHGLDCWIEFGFEALAFVEEDFPGRPLNKDSKALRGKLIISWVLGGYHFVQSLGPVLWVLKGVLSSSLGLQLLVWRKERQTTRLLFRGRFSLQKDTPEKMPCVPDCRWWWLCGRWQKARRQERNGGGLRSRVFSRLRTDRLKRTDRLVLKPEKSSNP